MALGDETIIQIIVCQFARSHKLPFIHIANEGKRTAFNCQVLKRMGFRSGVSDIFMPRGNEVYSGLWIELKAGKNKPTPMQQSFLDDMSKERYLAVCCQGSDSAIQLIKDFYLL